MTRVRMVSPKPHPPLGLAFAHVSLAEVKFSRMPLFALRVGQRIGQPEKRRDEEEITYQDKTTTRCCLNGTSGAAMPPPHFR
jgi:hypothetical protein